MGADTVHGWGGKRGRDPEGEAAGKTGGWEESDGCRSINGRQEQAGQGAARGSGSKGRPRRGAAWREAPARGSGEGGCGPRRGAPHFFLPPLLPPSSPFLPQPKALPICKRKETGSKRHAGLDLGLLQQTWGRDASVQARSARWPPPPPPARLPAPPGLPASGPGGRSPAPDRGLQSQQRAAGDRKTWGTRRHLATQVSNAWQSLQLRMGPPRVTGRQPPMRQRNATRWAGGCVARRASPAGAAAGAARCSAPPVQQLADKQQARADHAAGTASGRTFRLAAAEQGLTRRSNRSV